MRKILTLLLVISTLSTFAQHYKIPHNPLIVAKELQVTPPVSSRVGVDTVLWAPQDIQILYQVPDPDTSFHPMHIAGYVAGTDQLLSSSVFNIGLGSITAEDDQIFVNKTKIKVVGAKFAFGAGKFVSGDSTSSVVFKLYKLDGTFKNSQNISKPGPGTLVTTDTVPIYKVHILQSGVETLFTGSHTLYWDTALTVDAGAGYVIGFDISGLNPLDTLGLYSSTNGNPPIRERSLVEFFYNTSPPTWYSFLDPNNGWSTDIDLAIFPLVDYTLFDTISATICQNSTYNFNGKIINHPGTYHDTLVNGSSIGYDSVIVLKLTAATTDTTSAIVSSDTLTAILAGIQYQWIDCNTGLVENATGQSFVAPHTGSYKVVVSTNGCIDTSTCYDIVECSARYALYQDTTTPHHWYAVNEASGNGKIHYLWSWGDGGTDTVATPIHIYSDSAFYTICLSIHDSLGCNSTYCDSSTYIRSTENAMITVNVVFSLPTGISDILKNPAVSIYPNPANNSFVVETISTGEQLLQVYDITGKMISTHNIQNSKTAVDVSKWAKGMYIVSLKNGTSIINNKLVIE